MGPLSERVIFVPTTENGIPEVDVQSYVRKEYEECCGEMTPYAKVVRSKHTASGLKVRPSHSKYSQPAGGTAPAKPSSK
jgi:hypothetical protein